MADERGAGRDDAVLQRKQGVERVASTDPRVTCLGPASRETYTDWLTSVEEHFVLHRSNIPEIDQADWTLSITGTDESPVELPFETLREEYPRVAVPHTMVCAGNGRRYFDLDTPVVDWGFNGVSTAWWTGTPLDVVMQDCGIQEPDGRWVTAVGDDEPIDGTDVFARSIPLSKILKDCILAYGMNGRPLPPEHGFPMRLLVPGWYGVNSVKWLRELRVMEGMVSDPDGGDDGEYDARWQQDSYRIIGPDEQPTHHETIPEYDTWAQIADPTLPNAYTFDQNVNSMISAPSGEAPVRRREDGYVEVLGVAWAGDDAVARVEISTDGGASWQEATFVGPAYPNAWRLFRYLWRPAPGEYVLLSRATDEHGRRQPAKIGPRQKGLEIDLDDAFPWNQEGNAANAYEPLSVTVEVTH